VGASAPASRGAARGNGQPWGLQWCLREDVKHSKGDSASLERELAVRPPMADGGSAPACEGRTQWPL
jgi:hypothetical protein